MNKVRNPKVSVIITTHNRANLLPRAVCSVLTQTFTDYEIIIVDDASTDCTQEVIDRFDDPRIRSIRHEINRRQSASINTGIAHAKGEYIAFLDDDDEFTPTSLTDRLAVIESAPSQVALVYGWGDKFNDATGKRTQGRRLALKGVEAFEYALTGINIGSTSTLLVRTSAAKDIGGFDEHLRAGNDSFFICSIGQKYEITFLPKVIMIYHIEHGSHRMTDIDEEQRISIDTHFDLHINKFSCELEKRPKTHASLLRLRSVYAMEYGRVSESISSCIKALKLHPLNIGNLHHLLRLIKVFIFYVSPLSRYRIQVQIIQRMLRLRSE